jgi:hypothetical protein
MGLMNSPELEDSWGKSLSPFIGSLEAVEKLKKDSTCHAKLDSASII